MNDHIRRPAARSAFSSLAGAFLSSGSQDARDPSVNRPRDQRVAMPPTAWVSPFGDGGERTVLGLKGAR